MKRSELEHVIRAAGAIADDREIAVIGSQSILGQLPDAPATLRVSMEADVYPLQHPDRSDLIDGRTVGRPQNKDRSKVAHWGLGFVLDRKRAFPHQVRIGRIGLGAINVSCDATCDGFFADYLARSCASALCREVLRWLQC